MEHVDLEQRITLLEDRVKKNSEIIAILETWLKKYEEKEKSKKPETITLEYLHSKYDATRKQAAIRVRCPIHREKIYTGSKGFGLHYENQHGLPLVEPLVFKIDNVNLVLSKIDDVVFV